MRLSRIKPAALICGVIAVVLPSTVRAELVASTPFRIDGAAGDVGADADLACNAAGGALVAWTADVPTLATRIFARGYGTFGNELGAAVAVDLAAPSPQEQPSVLPLGGTSYLVAWNEKGTTRGRIVDNGQLAQEPSFLIAPRKTLERCVLSDASFAVSWVETVGPSDARLKVAVYRVGGSQVSTTVEVSNITLGHQIRCNRDGTFAVLATTRFNDGSGSCGGRILCPFAVTLTQYLPSGTLAHDPVPISNGPDNEPLFFSLGVQFCSVSRTVTRIAWLGRNGVFRNAFREGFVPAKPQPLDFEIDGLVATTPRSFDCTIRDRTISVGFAANSNFSTGVFAFEHRVDGGHESFVQLDDLAAPGEALHTCRIGDRSFLAVGSATSITSAAAAPVNGQVFSLGQRTIDVALIDPFPDLITADGGISQDTGAIVAKRDFVDGVAADGASRLIIRAPVPGPGQTEFILAADGSIEDGMLSLLDGSKKGLKVTASAVDVGGQFWSFATYYAPPSFTSTGNVIGSRGLSRRFVDIVTSHKQGTMKTGSGQTRAIIVRPPVLAMHGLLSNGSVWSAFIGNITRTGLDVRVVAGDYKETNIEAFAVNSGVPRKWINATLAGWRLARNVATTKVDYIGHSMGGILGRVHLNREDYLRAENYFEGDVHTFVTIDTPHAGSEWANEMVRLPNVVKAGLFAATSGVPFLGQSAVGKIAAALWRPSAIVDLQVGSPANLALQRTAVPSHAIYAWIDIADDFSAIRLLSPQLAAIYQLLELAQVGVTSLFGGQRNDLIVSVPSQLGGVNLLARFEEPGAWHTNVYKKKRVADHYLTLLDEGIDSSIFGSFPAVRDISPASAARALTVSPPVVLNQGNTGQLVITSPQSGSVLRAGSQLPVTVTAPPGVEIAAVVIFGSSFAGAADSLSAPVTVDIPADAIGPDVVFALGVDSTGRFYASEGVSIVTDVGAELLRVVPTPTSVALELGGDPFPLSVFGEFDDGTARALPATTLSFSSLDSTIASVSAEGALSPQAAGTTRIVIASGGVVASVRVYVDARRGCGNGILAATEQCDDGGTLAGDGCSPGCRLEDPTTSTTTTTIPTPPCAQPVTSGNRPTASDCLFILRTAVGALTCTPSCICSPDGNNSISATDALLCLRVAVGQAGLELICACG